MKDQPLTATKKTHVNESLLSTSLFLVNSMFDVVTWPKNQKKNRNRQNRNQLKQTKKLIHVFL